MSTTSLRARPWRVGASAVAAATLALAGLVAVGSPASAAANVTASISPGTIAAGETKTFTLTFTGGSAQVAESFSMPVPSALTAVNVNATAGGTASSGASAGNWESSFDTTVSPNLIKVRTKNGTISALAENTTVTVTFTATAVANPPASIALAPSFHTNRGFGGNGSGLISGPPSLTNPVTAQTIDFAPLPDRTFGDPDFTVSAIGGGSGQPVVFSASGNCTATGTNGTTIHLTGAGECTVTANQAAAPGYSAAAPASQPFDIDKASQTIDLTPILNQTYGDPAVTVTASASSLLPVALTAEGNCSLSGTSLSLTGAGTCTVKANQAGNDDYSAAPEEIVSFSIAKDTATLTLDNLGPFTYDGLPHAATVTTVPLGLEIVSITYDGSATAPTNAGTYDVEASLDNADYQGSASGSLKIDAAKLTGAFTAEDKVYDSNTSAAILDCSLPAGVVEHDDVDIDCSGATATFASKDAGLRTVSLTGAVLTGADAGNYELDGVADTEATISPKTVTGKILASDKTYDGNDSAVASEDEIEGAYDSDDVELEIIDAKFDGVNAGAHTVTANIALTGADAGNYVLSSGTASFIDASIWKKSVTPTVVIADKVYDGLVDAAVQTNSLSGVLTEDVNDVELVVSGAEFPSRDVGSYDLTGGLSLTGAKALNYELSTDTWADTAEITAKALTASFTANDKVWDGTATATIGTVTLSGKVTGDVVALTGGTVQFVDGTNTPTSAVNTWTVLWTGFSLSGADAGNYSLAATSLTTTATISALYEGVGFYEPVDKPIKKVDGSSEIVWNTIKGGQTVPLKFDVLNATSKVEQTSLSVFGPNPFKVSTVTCGTTNVITDEIEVLSTGGTSLRYDGTAPTGQFIQNWKTPTGTGCYKVTVSTIDGTVIGPAYFQTKK